MYVFAVLTATEHAGYDALDTGQWSFWVLLASTIQETNQASMGLARVVKLAGDAGPYADLAAAVRRALDGERAVGVSRAIGEFPRAALRDGSSVHLISVPSSVSAGRWST